MDNKYILFLDLVSTINELNEKLNSFTEKYMDNAVVGAAVVVIILIVATFFEKFKNSSAVKGCMSGLKPAVIGLIGSAAVSTALTVFFSNGFSLNVIPTLSFISSAIIFAVSLSE
jgi:chromate transport protein ChrA